MAPRTARYGTWQSPVTTDFMTARTVTLGSLTADGDALLWLESRPGESGRTTLMRWRPGGDPSELTPNPVDVGNRVHEYGGGAYCGRAGEIAFSNKRDGSVWRIGSSAGQPEPILVTRVSGCRFADFAFDPAARRLFAVREDHRDRPPTTPLSAIVALDLSGSMPPEDNAGIVLVEGPDFLAAPRPSPDGAALAWVQWDHPDMPWDRSHLRIASFDPAGRLGSPIELDEQTGGEAIVQPEWLDQHTLLFCSDRDDWWQTYRWRPGEAPTKILSDEFLNTEIGGPAWNFATRYVSQLPDGRLLAIASRDARRSAMLVANGELEALPVGSVAQAPVPYGAGMAAIATPPDAPAVLILLDRLDATEGRVLARSAPALLSADDVSMGEPFDFETEGGTLAHAIFYPPRNARYAAPAEEAPPLITLAHGGPTAMSARVFSPSIQWWTSRGFAVVDVNYRGSTGFGRRYREALRASWGVADVEDCAAAVRHLIARGRVDPKRVAIRGGSAGGFTALAALTTTDLFAAGGCLYGIGDLALLARDTHKFESRYLDGLVGKLPGAADLFASRSPLNHLDRLAAPIIFFQGADDRVVPPNQAEIMVRSLRARGIPVAYYLFEGEGHGFRKAETIRRVLELELSFYGRIFGFEPAGLSETVRLSTDP